MKFKQIFYLSFILITGIFAFNACRKSDQQANQSQLPIDNPKFFSNHRTTDPTEAALVDFIRRKNEKSPFINKVISQIGYPYWDKMVVIPATSNKSGRGNSDSLHTTFFIPFVRESQNFVNASMVIQTYPGDTTFSYKCDWQYKQRINGSPLVDTTAENFAFLFMYLDHNVFGHTRFTITDTTLFQDMPVPAGLTGREIRINPSANGKIAYNRNSLVTVMYCFYGYYCGTLDAITCNDENGCDYLNCATGQCYATATCFDFEVEEGTGGGGGSGTGTGGTGTGGTSGGSGGTGSTTPPPCPTGPVTPDNVTNPCDPGWNSTSLSTIISFLSNYLSLSSSESTWLAQNPTLAIQLYQYATTSTVVEKVTIAKEHLQRMISDIEYYNFVQNHMQTGNAGLTWWNDLTWIENPNNFNLDITRAAEQIGDISAAEKALIAIYPLQAYIIRNNVPVAFAMSESRIPTGTGLNDKRDAFRHAFFQAINTRDVPGRIFPNTITGSAIVGLFATAHESEVPAQLQLEKEMDLFNNNIGISYCWNCWTTANNSIADALMIKLNNGELKYLKPIWSPKFNPRGELINLNGDPNFWGPNGANVPSQATHGIIVSTQIIPTNQ